jgi:hypothetical protein
MKGGREAGFVNWKTKIVLVDWPKDSKGYRIEYRDERPIPAGFVMDDATPMERRPDGLYIVGNSVKPSFYRATASRRDILFDLANTARYPFRSVEEEAALSDGVIADRVVTFVKTWGLLRKPPGFTASGHTVEPEFPPVPGVVGLVVPPEQSLSEFLQMAVDLRKALASPKEALPMSVHLSRCSGAHIAQEADERGSPYLLATARTLFDFCCMQFSVMVAIGGSYYCCANPNCRKFGPNPKVEYPEIGGRPRKYCSEACDKVDYRLRAKARGR